MIEAYKRYLKNKDGKYEEWVLVDNWSELTGVRKKCLTNEEKEKVKKSLHDFGYKVKTYREDNHWLAFATPRYQGIKSISQYTPVKHEDIYNDILSFPISLVGYHSLYSVLGKYDETLIGETLKFMTKIEGRQLGVNRMGYIVSVSRYTRLKVEDKKDLDSY